MMLAWIYWLEFWACFLRVEPRRTARLYRLDDYRPTNNPTGRAA